MPRAGKLEKSIVPRSLLMQKQVPNSAPIRPSCAWQVEGHLGTRSRLHNVEERCGAELPLFTGLEHPTTFQLVAITCGRH